MENVLDLPAHVQEEFRQLYIIYWCERWIEVPENYWLTSTYFSMSPKKIRPVILAWKWPILVRKCASCEKSQCFHQIWCIGPNKMRMLMPCFGESPLESADLGAHLFYLLPPLWKQIPSRICRSGCLWKQIPLECLFGDMSSAQGRVRSSLSYVV